VVAKDPQIAGARCRVSGRFGDVATVLKKTAIAATTANFTSSKTTA
jgi:hypothetical protein